MGIDFKKHVNSDKADTGYIMKRIYFILVFFILWVVCLRASVSKIVSPDGRLALHIFVEKEVSVELFADN